MAEIPVTTTTVGPVQDGGGAIAEARGSIDHDASSRKAKKDSKKESKSSSKFAKASASHKSADSSSAAASATDETVEEPIAATESPNPNIKTEDTPDPVELPVGDVKPSVPSFADPAELQSLCLNSQAKTCILAILPPDDASDAAMSAMSVHKQRESEAASHAVLNCLSFCPRTFDRYCI